jgi:6-phosphogluconolactonase
MPEIRRIPGEAARLDACAALIAESLREALAGTAGRVSFMVSGGRTPRGVLSRLAAHDLPWSRIDVFASDERLVPPPDPASTEGMVRDALSDCAPEIRYHGFGPSSEPGTALAHWKSALAGLRWPVAVAFLGIGEDAHTASIFPGRPECARDDDWAFAVPQTEPHPHARLTLGPVALLRAERTVAIVQGAAKRTALSRALAPGATCQDTPATLFRDLPDMIILTD